MQQSIFPNEPEILEPNTGDIINLEGFTAQCIDFDCSDELQCLVCDLQPFPCSVCCNLINCFAIERQDGKGKVFKIIEL